MQTKLNIFLFVVVFLICCWIFVSKTQILEYQSTFFVMDTSVQVKLYSDDKKKAEMTLKEVEKIYQEYHQLTHRYEAFDGVVNLYTIAYNTLDKDTLTLDTRLYQLIEKAKSFYDQSNQTFNVAIGCLVDVWKPYREAKTGLPSMEELNGCSNMDPNEIVLLENNQIKNNHVHLDLGGIAKGYATEEVKQYLKKMGFFSYLINAGGNVVVGNYYQDGSFKIGIQNPNQVGKIEEIIKGNNISVVTSGSYERYYEYEGKRYHHILDGKTKMPPNYCLSVTVITEDSALADFLSTTLFLMPVDEGVEYIKQFDAEAIWYQLDGTVFKSEGMHQYE